MLKRLHALPTAPLKYRKERVRLAGVEIATSYLQAVQAIRDMAEHGQIEALKSTLIGRLRAGYAKNPNPTRDALWSRLLAEYEICKDALSENCLWRFQDRLHEIEARWG